MIKNKYKKSVLIIVIIIGIIMILSSFTTLIKTSNVNSSYNISKELAERVKQETQGMEGVHIVKCCVELTAELLSFSQKEDLSINKANCVGYSKVCTALCNYSFKVHGKKYKASHVRGYLSILSINLCTILKSLSPKEYENFVKDHDFVEIGFNNGKYIYVDPSIYDLTGTMLLQARDYPTPK